MREYITFLVVTADTVEERPRPFLLRKETFFNFVFHFILTVVAY